MSPSDAETVRVVVVLGGDRSDRSTVLADVVLTAPGRTLVLTCGHGALDPRLDTADAGGVEVRRLDPGALVRDYVGGADDPQDEVLAALAVGPDAPLARTLVWEYVRRAAASAFWGTVVVDLDGADAAPRVLAAPGRLLAFVDRRWPPHRRFAAMAAGERAETRIRMAHRLADLCSGVRDLLAGVELVAAGADPHHVMALAELARGAVETVLTGDPRAGYVLEVPVPAPVDEAPRLEDEQLVLVVEALEVAVTLPPVLRRCLLVGSDHLPDDRGGRMRVHFRPDPRQWPPHLAPAGAVDDDG